MGDIPKMMGMEEAVWQSVSPPVTSSLQFDNLKRQTCREEAELLVHASMLGALDHHASPSCSYESSQQCVIFFHLSSVCQFLQVLQNIF